MVTDKGRGSDMMGIGMGWTDGGRETTSLLVRKYDEDQMAWTARRLDEDLVPLVLAGTKTLQQHHFTRAKVRPYEVVEYVGNLITTAGWAQLFKSILGGSPTLFSATVGRIGVGTGTTAAVNTDTALGSVSGMTGNNWILCGAAPTNNTSPGAGNPCTSVFTASFGSTAAVGPWNEFAVDQGTASAGPSTTATAPMMNHSANINAGTKSSGTWTATATLSFT